MNVLVTGIGGFIGSHCLEYWLDKTDWLIKGIDSFRHKGTLSRIDEVPNYDISRVKLFYHDLSVPIDRQLENRLVDRDLAGNDNSPIDYIINFASDSAVERSISDPGQCWHNNCQLIYNVLEFARKVKPKLFIQISTDEVYGEAELTSLGHKEWDVILPSNVYSASKAAQEALASSYWRTYDIPLVIVNIMNAIGEKQDKEKFLPKLIWKVATNQKMEIYGEPGKIGSRYYIHCKNIADALMFLAKKKPVMYGDGARRPERYNVVGDMEMDNLEVAKYVAEIMGKNLSFELIPAEKARKGYDRRYALDGTKLRELGWKHPISTLDSIKQIVNWTIEHPHWMA